MVSPSPPSKKAIRSINFHFTKTIADMCLKCNAPSFSRPGPRLKDAAIELYNFINGIAEEEVPAA